MRQAKSGTLVRPNLTLFLGSTQFWAQFLGSNVSGWPSGSKNGSNWHYSRFEVRLFIIRQSMNFGFWNFFLVQIIADYVNFHMTYHTYIWNHAGWHRSVLNMTHFQLFAWFGQTLLVRKMENKSKFLLGDTIGSKFNFKWSSWVWTMSSYQNLRSI